MWGCPDNSGVLVLGTLGSIGGDEESLRAVSNVSVQRAKSSLKADPEIHYKVRSGQKTIYPASSQHGNPVRGEDQAGCLCFSCGYNGSGAPGWELCDCSGRQWFPQQSPGMGHFGVILTPHLPFLSQPWDWVAVQGWRMGPEPS